MATKEDKRKAAAERAAKYRQRKVAKEDPAAAEEMKRQQEQAEADKARAKAEQEAKEAADKAKKEAEEKQLDEALRGALAMSLNMLTMAYNKKTGCPPATPTLGMERADAIATAWVPVLGPLFRKYAGSMAGITAAVITAGMTSDWLSDREQYLAEHRTRIVDAQEPLT